MATTYELTMIPPTDQGPWRYSVRIATGFGPNESWATPPIALKARDKDGATAEAREALTTLRKTLDRAGVS